MLPGHAAGISVQSRRIAATWSSGTQFSSRACRRLLPDAQWSGPATHQRPGLHAGRRCGVSTRAEPAGVARTATVTELLLLLQVKEDCSARDGEVLLDSLWSLQYMTGPGVLCAFAGAALPLPGGALPPPPVTHAVHFRLTNAQAAARFRQHPQFAKLTGELVGWTCDACACLQLDAQVPAELEDMFRRGPEWETGVEHLLLLRAQGSASEADAAQYSRQLAVIAKSSLAGALQSSAATLAQGSDAVAGAGGGGCQALLTRFERRAQLQGFLALPPVQRLLAADPALPVKVGLSTAFSIAEAKNSRSSSTGANRL